VGGMRDGLGIGKWRASAYKNN